MRIGILIYSGVDLLDCGGPYEVFLTASRLAERDGRAAPFEVVTIGVGDSPIAAYGGLGLVPQTTIDDAGQVDVLIVPGAIAIDDVLADTRIRRAIETLGAEAEITTSVCTGAFLLGAQGLLEGRRWTTHWEDVDLLADRIGDAGATREVRWVDSGEIVTSGGLSSGIAMALHLVERAAGRDLATRTARQIEYDWDHSGRR